MKEIFLKIPGELKWRRDQGQEPPANAVRIMLMPLGIRANRDPKVSLRDGGSRGPAFSPGGLEDHPIEELTIFRQN